jgi:hypothetical protein
VQKLTIRTIPILFLLLFGSVNFAKAQNFSAYFGGGSATDGQNKVLCADSQLPGETASCFDAGLGAQVPNAALGYGPGELGPSMGGAFGTFGAQFMIKSHLWISGEYAFRFARADYAPAAGVTYRPGFYDFNAVYVPLTGNDRRFIPEFQAGLGGASLKFYETESGCLLSTTACASISQYIASSNHFQLHFSGAVKIYFKGNLFLRPAFDLHWVNNLTNEFNSSIVPQYTVAVGYTFGGH